MKASFYIGVYWGSRAEPLSQVRDKTLQTFQKLAEIDEQFLDWYEGGISRKKALEKRIVFDNETIEKLCLQHVKKGELEKNGVSKMGFLFGIWSGHLDEESSSVTFTVGSAFTSPHLCNSCVLTIPFEGGARERLLHIEKAKRIIEVFVEIWNPDYAVLTSHQLRDKLNVANKIGWITYHKTIRKAPSITNQIVYKKENNGHWFYFKESNYNESLSNELLSIKEMII
jgi:hypothetical protein